MEKTREFIVRHPALVALTFAFLAGCSTYNAFYAGISFGELRAEIGDHARAASEALGG